MFGIPRHCLAKNRAAVVVWLRRAYSSKQPPIATAITATNTTDKHNRNGGGGISKFRGSLLRYLGQSTTTFRHLRRHHLLLNRHAILWGRTVHARASAACPSVLRNDLAHRRRLLLLLLRKPGSHPARRRALYGIRRFAVTAFRRYRRWGSRPPAARRHGRRCRRWGGRRRRRRRRVPVIRAASRLNLPPDAYAAAADWPLVSLSPRILPAGAGGGFERGFRGLLLLLLLISLASSQRNATAVYTIVPASTGPFLRVVDAGLLLWRKPNHHRIGGLPLARASNPLILVSGTTIRTFRLGPTAAAATARGLASHQATLRVPWFPRGRALPRPRPRPRRASFRLQRLSC